MYNPKHEKKCVYCKRSYMFMTVDHFIPQSKIHLKKNKQAKNLYPCCSKCNSEKTNMMPDEWFNHCLKIVNRVQMKDGKEMYMRKAINTLTLMKRTGMLEPPKI